MFRSSVQDPYVFGGISASSFFFIASVVDLVSPFFSFLLMLGSHYILSVPVLPNNLRCAVPSRPEHSHTQVSEGGEGCQTQYYKVPHPSHGPVPPEDLFITLVPKATSPCGLDYDITLYVTSITMKL